MNVIASQIKAKLKQIEAIEKTKGPTEQTVIWRNWCNSQLTRMNNYESTYSKLQTKENI